MSEGLRAGAENTKGRNLTLQLSLLAATLMAAGLGLMLLG